MCFPSNPLQKWRQLWRHIVSKLRPIIKMTTKIGCLQGIKPIKSIYLRSLGNKAFKFCVFHQILQKKTLIMTSIMTSYVPKLCQIVKKCIISVVKPIKSIYCCSLGYKSLKFCVYHQIWHKMTSIMTSYDVNYDVICVKTSSNH